MANAVLRYEIFEPVDPSAILTSDVLGYLYASGAIDTKMAEYSSLNSDRVLTAPSVPSEPFTIPASPSGAKRVLVRLWGGRDRILITMARRPAIGGVTPNPVAAEYATHAGPDSVPYIALDIGTPVLLSLEPGAKIRARAAYNWPGGPRKPGEQIAQDRCFPLSRT